jgi:DNA-binding NarL/FixJ family response regulator
MVIKVALADDHQIFREGLRSMIENSKNIKVVGEASNGQEILDVIDKKHPDVVILDVNMPVLNGIEATKQIVKNKTKIKIIALSMHSDKRFVAEMLGAGAKGYLLKDCAFEELLTAIETVMKNKVFLSPGIKGVVIEDYVSRLKGPAATASLSPREMEVLRLIADGKSTKEIAFELNLSAKTIETHRRQIMEKMKFDSIADLIKYAIRENLTSLDSDQ